MAAFGDTLRQARAHKGISLIEAAQATYINRYYLVALEEENFSVLPDGATFRRGIVRHYDVRPDNTVQSELVADARVSYSGSGPLTKSTNRYGLGGWLHDALAWLWPF